MSELAGRLIRLALFAAFASAIAGGVWYAFLREPPQLAPEPGPTPAAPTADPPPPDPRLTFATPFRNVRPEVKYVGDAACSSCHAAIDKTYHKHPMGLSAAPAANAPPLEKYDAAANNPAVAQGFTLRVEQAGGQFRHIMAKDDLPPYAVTADVAIGSGSRGRSYLTVDNGAVWQTPVSWFSHEHKWDVSPGFTLPDTARRPILAECLFCHVDRVEPVPHAINRFREPLLATQANVGCERCHGPGSLHVAERLAGVTLPAPDSSIVNPKHLPPDLRMSVCQQCHLQGDVHILRRGRGPFDYRPGLPLEQFIAVFGRHPDFADPHKSVGQFEQMWTSKCFTKSGGKLDCTSCHDPHMVPADDRKEAFFRGKCLTCHDPGKGGPGCSLSLPERKAKNDGCIACHMPRAASGNIAHVVVTDHRVPRVPPPANPAGGRRLSPGVVPLVPLQTGPHLPPADERERDLGVALARLAANLPPTAGPVREYVGRLAEQRLTASLRIWPGDHDALVGQARLATDRGDTVTAMLSAQTAVALVPDSEFGLSALVSAATAADNLDRAAEAADRLVAINPRAVQHLLARAEVRLRRGDWAGVEADARAALAVQPLSRDSRAYLAVARAKQGDAAGGRKEYEAALGLAPKAAQRESLRQWYEDITRP
jgi:hypothetical protein